MRTSQIKPRRKPVHVDGQPLPNIVWTDLKPGGNRETGGDQWRR
jgi:hypothetical protein